MKRAFPHKEASKRLGSFVSRMPTTWRCFIGFFFFFFFLLDFEMFPRRKTALKKTSVKIVKKKVSIPRKKDLFPCSRGRPQFPK